MYKLLLIVSLIVLLIYFLTRKVVSNNKSKDVLHQFRKGFTLIESGRAVIQKAIKNTLYSVGIGLVMLIIILILAIKIKILFILLPISLYLLSQILLLNNQLKYLKYQQIWFNKNNLDVHIEWQNGEKNTFNLATDIQRVRAVKSVQKNNEILFGYYELTIENNKLYLPFLLEENPNNSSLFDGLKSKYTIIYKNSLYPII